MTQVLRTASRLPACLNPYTASQARDTQGRADRALLSVSSESTNSGHLFLFICAHPPARRRLDLRGSGHTLGAGLCAFANTRVQIALRRNMNRPDTSRSPAHRRKRQAVFSDSCPKSTGHRTPDTLAMLLAEPMQVCEPNTPAAQVVTAEGRVPRRKAPPYRGLHPLRHP